MLYLFVWHIGFASLCGLEFNMFGVALIALGCCYCLVFWLLIWFCCCFALVFMLYLLGLVCVSLFVLPFGFVC